MLIQLVPVRYFCRVLLTERTPLFASRYGCFLFSFRVGCRAKYAIKYQNPYLRLLMTTGSAVLRRMASDSATDKASGLGTRKGNTSLRGSKDGILGTEDDERERVL
jgi:hypothetical protein